jgi:hypothetical protein
MFEFITPEFVQFSIIIVDAIAQLFPHHFIGG